MRGNFLKEMMETKRENGVSTMERDVSPQGNVSIDSSAYDTNGNMINDSRGALNLSYNVLNLLSEVKTTSGTLKARYSYLADGTKLRVRDNGEVNGFDYTGSLTYRKSSAGLQLESANFGVGVIRVTGSTGNQHEVNYFLTDHLGSVREIVDGNGVVKERNDYYPFGARHVRSDYVLRDGNRLKYNGKEEQVTGGLDFLDYGARMYDSGLGRWFVNDPQLENYLSISPYVYCGNYVVGAIDIGGRLYIFVNGFNPGEYMAHEGRNMTRDMHGLPIENYNPDCGFQSNDFYGWASIDKLYIATYDDNNALYVNGSFEPSSKARKRYEAGMQKGIELLMQLRSGDLVLSENETIKVVGYSMGGAYAAGMASVLMQDAEYRKRLEFVDYLAPYQPDQFEHPRGLLGRQFQMRGDWLVDAKKIKGIDELDYYLNNNKWYNDILGGHMLNRSFKNFLQSCFNAGVPIFVK